MDNIEIATYQFSGQQQILHKDLLSKNAGLADMYLGALIVVKQSNNPDRYSHAAHGIREVMEKLPLYIDVEIKEQGASLKSKVRGLQLSCQPLIEKVNRCNLGKSGEKPDKFFNKIKSALESFFLWFEKQHPTRNAEIAATLQTLDESGRVIPQPLQKLNVKYWDEMRDFFQAVAHHGIKPTEGVYQQWLDAFEKFLLDRLHPRTFIDFDEIDKIIQEGEANA